MCNPTQQPPRRDIYEIHEELDGDCQHDEPTGSIFLPENIKGDT